MGDANPLRGLRDVVLMHEYSSREACSTFK